MLVKSGENRFDVKEKERISGVSERPMFLRVLDDHLSENQVMTWGIRIVDNLLITYVWRKHCINGGLKTLPSQAEQAVLCITLDKLLIN